MIHIVYNPNAIVDSGTVDIVDVIDHGYYFEVTDFVDRDVARYYAGFTPPNYPMPVTLDDADTANNWLNLALCPLYTKGKQSVPCEVCIDRFLDALE